MEKALFDLLRLRPILAGFLFRCGADPDPFFLGLQDFLFGRSFGFQDSLVGLGFQSRGCRCSLAVGDPFPPAQDHIRDPESGQDCHHGHPHEKQYGDVDRHLTCTSCIRMSKCGTIAAMLTTRREFAL